MIVEIRATSAVGSPPASALSVSSRFTALASVAALALMAMAMAMATPAMADAPADLVAAAKQEGQLTTIALPHDWCGYGGVITVVVPGQVTAVVP